VYPEKEQGSCFNLPERSYQMIFEIYFSDLTEEAQKRYLEFQGVDDPAELNAEYSPLCILER
jgi:hypothetical protein